jgi:Ca-activated chloride channel family protein
MILTDSEFKGSASFDRILELARGSIGSDLEGYRTEFVQLVETCKMLSR